MADANTLGLALSGGGSRAAAFHCGTVAALDEQHLLEKVDVVSTVSGGSVFGAAWMAARLAGKTTAAFIASMQTELRRGFVLRSLLSWKLPLLLVPGFRRTDLIADTFDRVLCGGRTLADLPQAPILCLNASVLNHGQVGKFSRFGFSTRDLGKPRLGGGSTAVPMPEFELARPAAASAASPVGLPPLLLGAAELGAAPRAGLLEGTDPLALSDGGVLENLGVQTLLKGRRFGTWNIVVSDAGQRDVAWRPRRPGQWLTAFAIAALSASSLRRVLELMNDKENRSMRSATVLEAERSWMVERIGGATGKTLPEIVRDIRGAEPSRPRRRLFFVRLNQEWDSLLANVPAWRLRELSRTKDAPVPAGDARAVETFLETHTEVRLGPARALYRELGSDLRVAGLNRASPARRPRGHACKRSRHEGSVVADDLRGGPADQDQHRQDQPGVLGAVGRGRVVVADHGQHGRHREEGVVLAAELRPSDQGFVQRLAGAHAGHDAAVGGHDAQPDVGGHQRSQQRADVDVRGAPVEDLHQRVGGGDQQQVAERYQRRLESRQPGDPEQVVQDPGEHQDRDRHGERGRCAEPAHADAAPAEVVDEPEEREPGQPGGQRLPAEPVQPLGRGGLLAHRIEGAAVHDRDPRDLLAEASADPGEVVGGADPEDAGEDVRPAEREIEPLEEEAHSQVHRGVTGARPDTSSRAWDHVSTLEPRRRAAPECR